MTGPTDDSGSGGGGPEPHPRNPHRFYGVVVYTGVEQNTVFPGAEIVGPLDGLLPEPDRPSADRRGAAEDQPSAESRPPDPPRVSSDRDDLVAFSDFYRERLPKLIVYVRYLGASLDDASDVAQETMRKAHERWSTLTNPTAWTRTVAAREYLTMVTRGPRETSLDDDAAHDNATHPLLRARDEIAEFDARDEFSSLVAGLPARQRQVLAATYDGATPAEIAEDLEIPAATVRSTLRHARNRVRESAPFLQPAERPAADSSRQAAAPSRNEPDEVDQDHNDEDTTDTGPSAGPDANQGGRP